MIQISINILSQDMAGGKSEKEQLAAALGALGFVPVATLSVAPRGSVEFEVTPVADEPNTGEPVAPKTRGRPKKDAPKPDAPADPAPAEAAQDAADEKAEQEAAKAAEAAEKPAEAQAKFGQEDMRAAGKAYAEAFGMDACLADIPGIIGHAAFKLVPEDEFDTVTRKIRAAIEAKKA